MFQFLFRYPMTVFTKGRFVLLSAWPGWVLAILVVVSACGLAALFRSKMQVTAPEMRGWRGWLIWGMQTAVVAHLLLLLWQPAMTVAELSARQNVIAVVVDDSRSMGRVDVDGKARLTTAVEALNGGLLEGLQKRFQTRLYTLGNHLTRIERVSGLTALDAATHLGNGLTQLAAETADLPVGAVLLLSDGAENTSGSGGTGVGLEAVGALLNRRLPVHTVGFGREAQEHDIEIEGVSVAAGAVERARISATISVMQRGYSGQKTMLTVREGGKTLAAQQITLAPDGVMQTETVMFSAGEAGAKRLEFGLEAMQDEGNQANNAVTRPILVSGVKRRILYVEGEPRWEYKFIRRAEDDDPTVQVVSMLRTSENKVYRQGIKGSDELASGFPTRAEDLFGYAGIVIGSVDADFFTPLQKELLREYVDRRGGGLLFLGGRSALSDGGWAASSLAEVVPTFLPTGRNNFHRNAATVELTTAGMDSPITKLLDDPARNAARWKKLTYLADYQDAGTPKPGATVLAELNVGRRRMPFLVTQNYGRGRTAVLATGGTWRWQMSEALGDTAHDLFWQQMFRWLVADSPGPVTAVMNDRTLEDTGRVRFLASVRDPQFQPATGAKVTAHILEPGGEQAMIDFQASPSISGEFQADWTAEKTGGYIGEIVGVGADGKELGRDAVTFQREDGVAENFHTAQNRPLLEQLSKETGGRYWRSTELKDLPRDIVYSEAGISVRSTKELWNMPANFFLLIGLLAGEWLLRRKWGIV